MLEDNKSVFNNGYVSPLPNMVAAVNTDSITDRLMPEVFRKQDDIEKFIRKCEMYFEVKGISNKREQERLVTCLIDEELLVKYVETFGKIEGFQERLRRAFSKERDVIRDMKEMLEYRRRDEDIDNYIKKVEDLVDKLFSNKEFTKEKLTAKLLVQCVGNKRVEEEVILRKIQKVEEIKETLKLLDKVRNNEDTDNVMSFAAAVKGGANKVSEMRHTGRRDFELRQRMTSKFGNEQLDRHRNGKMALTCWNCNKVGHMRWECPFNSSIRCWTCERVGHISSRCPKKQPIQCFRCGQRGHISRECQGWKNRDKDYGRYETRKNDNYYHEKGTRWGNTHNEGGHNRYEQVNVIDEEMNREEGTETGSIAENIRPPKVRAPLVGELVGAIY